MSNQLLARRLTPAVNKYENYYQDSPYTQKVIPAEPIPTKLSKSDSDCILNPNIKDIFSIETK